ncbi:MAG: MATE family efflux transporter [Anaerolineae bacterium]|nr:MATE family efflux transporter [Anaerolineae bacterium]
MSRRLSAALSLRALRSLRRTPLAPMRRGRTGMVMRLALPAVSEQLLNMTVGLVDTWLVGHLGADAIAAVSISNQMVMLAYVLCSSIATGSTALIARCVGAHDTLTANRAVNQSALIAALIGLITTAAGVAFAAEAVTFMGATGGALPLASAYLRIVSWSFLLTTCLFVGNACLRGAGDTLSAMRVMMLVNAVNIVVAAVLIYGLLGLPRLGVVGSALGAAAGRSIGGVVVLWMLVRGRAGLRLDWRRLAPNGEIIRRILRIGMPTGVEMLLFRLGDMSYYRVVTSLGMAACAAHAVALNAQSLSFSPGFGFAIAATTLVGQGLGARDPKRAESDGYLAFRLGAIVMTIAGVFFFVFSRQIVGIFTDDLRVVALGSGPLRVVAVVQPLLASTMIFSGALRGAGDTRFPMLSNGTSVLVVRFGLALLFVNGLGLGLMGAWYALAIDMATRGLLNFLRFRSRGWQKVRV